MQFGPAFLGLFPAAGDKGSYMKEKMKLPYKITAALCGLILIIGLLFNGTLISNYTGVIAEDLGMTRAVFSVYSTIRNLVAFAINLAALQILRKLKAKTAILIGIALNVTSLALMTFSKSLPQLILLGLIGGCASAACGVVPAAIIIKNWYRSNYGTVLAMAASASGIAGVVVNPIMSVIVSRAGWRFGFRVVAAVSALGFLLVLLLLHEEPAELHLPAFGADKMIEKERETAIGRPSLSILGTGKAPKNFRRLVWMSALFTLGGLCVYTNTATILQDIGFTIAFATGAATSCTSLFSFIGKLVMGKINDCFGTAAVLRLWYFMCPLATMYFACCRIASIPLAIPGLILIGFCAGIYSVPIPLAANKLYKGKDDYTRVMSVCTAFTSLINAFSGLIYHGIYDQMGTYRWALLMATALSVLCFIVTMRLLAENRDVMFGGE